jgi:hypothetical protein
MGGAGGGARLWNHEQRRRPLILFCDSSYSILDVFGWRDEQEQTEGRAIHAASEGELRLQSNSLCRCHCAQARVSSSPHARSSSCNASASAVAGVTMVGRGEGGGRGLDKANKDKSMAHQELNSTIVRDGQNHICSPWAPNGSLPLS